MTQRHVSAAAATNAVVPTNRTRGNEEHTPKEWNGGDRTAYTPTNVHQEDLACARDHGEDFHDDDRR